MDVEYSLDMDDVLAFNRYHNANSPAIRRRAMIWRLALPIACVGMWLVLFNACDATARLVTAGGMGLVVVVVYLIDPLLIKWRMQRNVKAMYREASNRWFFEHRRLTITLETLTDAGATSVTTKKWNAIDRIVANQGHIYFYATAVSAFIVPKAAFAGEEAFRSFLDTARQYHSAAIV